MKINHVTNLFILCLFLASLSHAVPASCRLVQFKYDNIGSQDCRCAVNEMKQFTNDAKMYGKFCDKTKQLHLEWINYDNYASRWRVYTIFDYEYMDDIKAYSSRMQMTDSGRELFQGPHNIDVVKGLLEMYFPKKDIDYLFGNK